MKEILLRLDRNLRHTLAGLLNLLPAQAEPECAYTDGGVLVWHKGQRYLVSPDGNTFWLASPEWSIPLEGCRYPMAWAKWCLWRFFSRSPERLPAVLLAFALSGMGFIWLAVCPPDENPFGEWALWLFPMLSTGFVLVMNLCLALLLFSAIVAATARPVAEHIAEALRAAKAPALPAGETMLLETGGLIAPDILVCHAAPDETPDVFTDKLLAARREFGADKYVIAAPYRSDKIAICCPADASVERPDEELKYRADMGGISGDVSAETWDDYMEFLRRAAKPLSNFCTTHRARSQGAAAAVLAGLRVAMLLLAFASPAFAQPKTVRLKNYLAERATLIVPEQGTQFKASFQLAPITRTGDGKKNLLDLLQSGAAFTDADNAGPLLAVYVGGKLLAPEAAGAAEPAARASVGRGSAVPVEPSTKSLWDEMPDTLTLEKYKRDLAAGVKSIGNEIIPQWDFLFFVFWLIVFPILFAVSLIAWFVAKSAFKEMKSSANVPLFSKPVSYWGYQARNVIFGCAALFGVVLLMDCLIRGFFSLNLWRWVILALIEAVVLYKLVTFIVPNPKSSASGKAGGGWNGGGYNSSQLGSGQD